MGAIARLAGIDEDDERAWAGAHMVATVLDLTRQFLTAKPKSKFTKR